MSDKVKLSIIFGSIAVIMALLLIINKITPSIKANPEDTIGNTTGNLYNSGLFCQVDDVVYFANQYDGGALYKMNVDETNLEKLHANSTSYINVGGNYVYCFQVQKQGSGGSGLGYMRSMSGMYRIALKGKKAMRLSSGSVGPMRLVGNTLYYQYFDKELGINLHSISTSKEDDKLIANSIISPFAATPSGLYYSGISNDHNLYRLDYETSMNTLIFESNMCFPTIDNGYVYYMDISNNYCLCRYNLSDSDAVVEILTHDRLDLYNVGNGVIFYQKNSQTDPALMRMNTDGSNPEVVALGNYSNVNLTSNYAYFSSFGMETPVYKTPLYGAIAVTNFDVAKDAAMANTD